MEVEKVKVIGLKPLQAFFHLSTDTFGSAVDSLTAIWLPVDATLAGQKDLCPSALEGCCDRLLTFAVFAIAIGRVEMIDAMLEGSGDRANGGIAGYARTSHASQWPATESQC
jgi:hypothetical protein